MNNTQELSRLSINELIKLIVEVEEKVKKLFSDNEQLKRDNQHLKRDNDLLKEEVFIFL